jgi:hypothetical protein
MGVVLLILLLNLILLPFNNEIHIMQVYPTTMVKNEDNEDILYDLCRGVICFSCFFIILLLSIIIFIVSNIEEDSSQSY